ETFSQLNSITYIGVFLRLVTYSHLPLFCRNFSQFKLVGDTKMSAHLRSRLLLVGRIRCRDNIESGPVVR
ncbi:hypothetical protein, partial [Enterobacter kobei]|uniref:hypothetical protein n=1 Tax=Enterobacter kobei TaxID=208224 RepID=UPI0039C97C61